MSLMKYSVLLVVLLLSYLHHSDSAAFDYYVLAIQWPSTKCRDPYSPPCYNPYPADFTIHGLWPANYSGVVIPRAPPYYGKKTLRSLLTTTTVHNLYTTWPQLQNRGQADPDLEFWAYEWNQHGCISGMQPNDYFSRADGLFRYLKVKNLLAHGGIAPGGQYIVAAIQHYAGGAANLKPNIVCWADPNGVVFLFEIRYCTNLNGQLMPCRITTWQACAWGQHTYVYIAK